MMSRFWRRCADRGFGKGHRVLHRGQGSVGRKLCDMLPRLRDNRLHADLSQMLRSPETNIALASGVARRIPY